MALEALGWVMLDSARADRFLALTGLDVQGLRARLTQASVQMAVFDFLADYEPDLLACAQALGTGPDVLLGAWQSLNQAKKHERNSR